MNKKQFYWPIINIAWGFWLYSQPVVDSLDYACHKIIMICVILNCIILFLAVHEIKVKK